MDANDGYEPSVEWSPSFITLEPTRLTVFTMP